MEHTCTPEILKRFIIDCISVDREYFQTKLKPRFGQIPPEIKGSLIRNGVGKFENHGVKYQHLFDGDGMISNFIFEQGKVFYSNRFVQTEEYIKENQAGKMLFRSLGTNLPGGIRKNFGKLKIKNTANTNVIYHGGKLLALWEGGLPHELDLISLNTFGRYDYEGKLHRQKNWVEPWVNPELAFSAHPKIHPNTGEMFNFGMVSGIKNYLATHLVSPEGKITAQKFYPMDELHFVHDFVLTEDKTQVFFLSAISFDLWQTLWGMKTALDSIHGKGNPTKIFIIDPAGNTKTLETDFCFIFHFANGFKDQQGNVIVDALRMDEFPESTGAVKMMHEQDFKNVPAYLTRYTLDLKANTVKQQRLSSYPIELPNINPNYTSKTHRYVWGIGTQPQNPESLLQSIVKIDTQNQVTLIRDFYPHIPGEPVMIPKKGSQEDKGWLLTLLYNYDLRISQLAILDSQSLDLIAMLDLPHALPMSFHGTWIDFGESGVRGEVPAS